MQFTTDAIAFAKNLAAYHTRPVQLNLVNTYAGSFGLRLAAATHEDLFGRPPLDEVYDEMGALLASGANELFLKERLTALKVGPARHYRELLRGITQVGSGITFGGARSSAREVGFASLTAVEARRTADLLGKIEGEIPATYEVDGVFVAIDTERKTYKF